MIGIYDIEFSNKWFMVSIVMKEVADNNNILTNTNYYTTTGSESWLESAVANVGPIAVCIYVSSDFQSYSSG